MAQNDKPATGKPPRKPAAKRQPKKVDQAAASAAPVVQQADKAKKAAAAKKPASKATASQQSDKTKPVAARKAKTPAEAASKPASRSPAARQADKAVKEKAPAKTNSRTTVARKPSASNAPVDEAKKPRAHRKPVEKFNPDDVIPADDPFLGCTPREARFIDLWVACHNGTQAYRAAGYAAASDQIAAVCASQLLRKPKVQPYLAKRKAEFYAATETQRDRLLGTIVEASFADPRELSRYEYRACRYCWDEQHRYQYTPAELARAKEKYEQDKASFVIANGAGSGDQYPAFDEQGGATYDGRRDPHPDCPECFGEGRGSLRLGDTRHLSPAALAIYAGTEVGKDGIKVRYADQTKYRELLGRVVGLLDDDRELNLTVRASEEDLDKLYAAARAEAEKNKQAMLERSQRLAAEEVARDDE